MVLAKIFIFKQTRHDINKAKHEKNNETKQITIHLKIATVCRTKSVLIPIPVGRLCGQFNSNTVTVDLLTAQKLRKQSFFFMENHFRIASSVFNHEKIRFNKYFNVSHVSIRVKSFIFPIICSDNRK